MKRNLLVCLCFMFFCVEVHAEVSTWDGISSSNRWFLKRDTINQVCHITSAEELAGLSKLYQALNSLQLPLDGYTIFLDCDIDLANHEWTPIGVLGNYYSPNYGFTFEGNGHTISNMLITSCPSQYIKSLGLFGYCANQNFSVKDLTINGTIRYPSESLGAWDEINVGGIIGYGNINSMVNCHSNVNIYISDGSAHNRVGGIAGNLFTVGEKGVYKCTSKSEISVNGSKSCNLWVGGICGYNGGEKSKISCCSSNSNLTTYSGKGAIVGGITGDIGYGVSMDDCLFTGNITIYDANHGFIGGIAGMSDGDEIKNCIATGTISKKSGIAYMSGIVQAKNANCIVSDCYYTINNVSTNGVGTYILNSELKNGVALPNYDTNIWDFTSGENIRIVVKEKVDSIMFNESSDVYYIGENRALDYFIYPIDAYNKTLTWSIDDSSIATIDSNTGEITANKEGVATITATSNDDNSIKASVTITFKLHNPDTHLMTNNPALEPTCDKEGNSEYYFCEKCNRYYSDQDATEVVELNSWIIPATGLHIPMDPKKENEVAATCTIPGGYEDVEYCSVCNIELSRTPVEIPSLGHVEGAISKNNEIEPNCAEEGSYDNVVYCSVCNKELSKETIIVPATGIHIASNVVKENEIEETCGTDGSYDDVEYCSVCNAEISRVSHIVPATENHNFSEVIIENIKEPTDTEAGYYDSVIYCLNCNKELSRETTEIAPSSLDSIIADSKVMGIYSVSGLYAQSPSKGVYIVRYMDGSVKKMYIK